MAATTLVTVPPNNAVQLAQPAAAALPEDSSCKNTMQTILEIAIRILAPLATALAMYFTLPFSVSAVCIPIVTAATVFAMTFFFARPKPAEPTLPLTATAPLGLQNMGGNDCWLNSLAQMLRIDKKMNDWFTNVPKNLDIHTSYFRYFTQALLANLPDVLPEEAYGNLAADDVNGRAAIDRYANLVRGMAPAVKQNLFTYLRFLRQFPLADNPNAGPREMAEALLEFKTFMKTYEKGARTRPGQALMALPVENRPAEEFNSHTLRMAIARVCPQINRRVAHDPTTYNDNSQQDPTEAFPKIFSYFLPDNLKVSVQERKHFTLPRNPNTGAEQRIEDVADGADVIDGRTIVKNETPQVAMLSCGMEGSRPNAQNFLERYFEEPNHDLDNRVKRQIGGVEYIFPLLKTERQFQTAPDSLWISPKRFGWVKPQWAGLHRMMPNWFHAALEYSRKNKEAVEFQKTLEIQPVQGRPVRYNRDGFIRHKGEMGGGHYISYKIEKDDQGQPLAYFEMDDSRIKRLSEAQMLAALETAYVVHYSKEELNNGNAGNQ